MKTFHNWLLFLLCLSIAGCVYFSKPNVKQTTKVETKSLQTQLEEAEKAVSRRASTSRISALLVPAKTNRLIWDRPYPEAVSNRYIVEISLNGGDWQEYTNTRFDNVTNRCEGQYGFYRVKTRQYFDTIGTNIDWDGRYLDSEYSRKTNL